MGSIVIRIKKYLEHKNIAPSVAEKQIGSSNGSLSKPFKANTTIKTDMLEKFLNSYQDINCEWLLTGRGTMLKDTNYNTTNDQILAAEPLPTYEKHTINDTIEVQNKLIAMQEKEISRLEKELYDIKSRKSEDRKDKDTTTTRVALSKT